MKRNKGIRITMLIGGLLLTLAIPLITASLSVAFDPSSIITSAFWIRWAVVQLGVMSAFILVMNFSHHANLDKQEYIEKEEVIKKLVSSVDTDLNDFLEYYNRNNKKEAYRQDKKAVLLSKKEQLTKLKMVSQITPRRKKRINKVVAEIKKIEDETTEEYIEKNIDYIRVHYPHVSKSQLFSDEAVRKNRNIIDSISQFYFSKVAQRFINSALITAIFTSISVSGFLNWGPNLLYNLITTVFSISIAAYSGFSTANKAYKEVMLLNQLNRTSVLRLYNEWRVNKPAPVAAEVETSRGEENETK